MIANLLVRLRKWWLYIGTPLPPLSETRATGHMMPAFNSVFTVFWPDNCSILSPCDSIINQGHWILCQRSPTKGKKRCINRCILFKTRVRKHKHCQINECKFIICAIFFTCCQLKCKPSALYSFSLKSLKNSQPNIGDKIA